MASLILNGERSVKGRSLSVLEMVKYGLSTISPGEGRKDIAVYFLFELLGRSAAPASAGRDFVLTSGVRGGKDEVVVSMKKGW